MGYTLAVYGHAIKLLYWRLEHVKFIDVAEYVNPNKPSTCQSKRARLLLR